MMTFENHIDAVEKWVDKIVHAVCSIYNVAYFPAFTFLIEKLDFVVGGATPAQLELIEKLIKNFKVNIRKAQRSLAPVKKELPVKPIKKLEAKVETNNEKKLKFDKSPMTKSDKFEKPLTSPRDSTGKLTPSRHLRTSSQNLWTADVKLLKTSNLGKKTFFPYSITYDIKMKKITLKAAGDNISQSDTLIGVRIRDNSKHVLEIQLEGGNKIVSFATTELLETWAKFLETQC